MKRIALSTAALCLLAGCDFATKLLPVKPPANLTALCDPIPELPDPATLGDLLRADIELIGSFKACAARHKALSEWATR